MMKNIAVNTRLARDEDMETVFRLYGEAFGAEALAIFKKRHEWEFHLNPRTSTTPSRAWVAEEEDGDIIGFIASFPMLLKVGERTIMTSSSGDLLVTPSARGRGVAKMLSKAYRDSAQPLATDGFGYQPVTGHIYRSLGYREVECNPTFVRPMDLVPLLRFAAASGRLPRPLRSAPAMTILVPMAHVANTALRLFNRWRRPASLTTIRVEPLDDIPEEVYALWRDVAPSLPVAFVRDQAFLRWRFGRDPVSSHRLLAARNAQGRLIGYLAYSISEKPELRLGRLMDLLCSPERHDVVDALVGAFLREAEEQKLGAVIGWGLHHRLRVRVRRYLYLAPKTEQDPTLLFCAGDDELCRLVYDARNWHVTRADGDEGFTP